MTSNPQKFFGTPSDSLSSFMHGRDNNFDLIRLLASLMVLWSHSYALATGDILTEPFRGTLGMSAGEVAVDIFFVASGFLVTMSLYSRGDVGKFLRARALRIWPALVTAVAFCVLAVGAAFTTLPFSEYITHEQTLQFTAGNSLIVFGEVARLPGVFEHLPWAFTVNGSLWTLPFEVRSYVLLLLASLVMSRVFGFDRAATRYAYFGITAIALALYITDQIVSFTPISYLSNEDLRFYSLFFYGACFFLYREKLVMSTQRFCVIVALLGLAAFVSTPVFHAAYTLAIPFLVFFLAYVPASPKQISRRLPGDYSYGLYLFAFPIQQSIVYLKPGISPELLTAYAIPLTTCLAIASWHLVEKPTLRLK